MPDRRDPADRQPGNDANPAWTPEPIRHRSATAGGERAPRANPAAASTAATARQGVPLQARQRPRRRPGRWSRSDRSLAPGRRPSRDRPSRGDLQGGGPGGAPLQPVRSPICLATWLAGRRTWVTPYATERLPLGGEPTTTGAHPGWGRAPWAVTLGRRAPSGGRRRRSCRARTTGASMASTGPARWRAPRGPGQPRGFPVMPMRLGPPHHPVGDDRSEAR